MSTSTLYVLVPPSRLFAAHWSFFLPNANEDIVDDSKQRTVTEGRRIHVSGDRLNGFVLEIIREYDVSEHKSVGSRQYAVGVVRACHLQQADLVDESHLAGGNEHKDEDEGGGYVDNHPTDDFEQACLDIEVPGSSMNGVADSKSTQGRVQRVEEMVARLPVH